MFHLLKFFFIGFVSLIIPPSNTSFQGIIKYKSVNSETGITDTLIYYFGKDKIKVDRIGRLSKNYGSYSNVYYDFEKLPNIALMWSESRKQMNEIEHSKKWVKINKIIPDTSRIQLKYNCQLRKIEYYSSYNDGNKYDVFEDIWFAKDLEYEINSGWDFSHNIFSNGSNCITLYKIRDVKSDNPEEKNITNILAAYEIIPMQLDDNIFEIPSK